MWCAVLLALMGVGAFPEAEGFGALAVGGRGGAVYHVTSLADAGPGSLRAGVERGDRPLTIVFAVGGNIRLESPLRITQGQLTLAGQTAPGQGVTVSRYPTVVSGCADVIIRYLRFRTGDFNGAARPADKWGRWSAKPAQGRGDLSGDAGDCLSVVNSRRVIIDHVSTSWGMDETLSVTHSNDVTVQWSIIGQSLNDSHHAEGRHGYGSLVVGRCGQEQSGGYTFHHNLWVHHWRRSPGFGATQVKEAALALEMDFVNNVIYNWGVMGSHSVLSRAPMRVNYVGNTLLAGPDTRRGAVGLHISPLDTQGASVYLQDNAMPVAPMGRLFATPRRFDFPQVTTQAPAKAYEVVLARAGASLVRDTIDKRLVEDVRLRRGGIIDSQKQVGGLPKLTGGAAPVDQDRDGMADAWEIKRGLDPKDAEDRNAITAAGATQLEVYLAELVEVSP